MSVCYLTDSLKARLCSVLSFSFIFNQPMPLGVGEKSFSLFQLQWVELKSEKVSMAKLLVSWGLVMCYRSPFPCGFLAFSSNRQHFLAEHHPRTADNRSEHNREEEKLPFCCPRRIRLSNRKTQNWNFLSQEGWELVKNNIWRGFSLYTHTSILW